jgi:NAD(P)-dependent dehydrogenase (short-subunit alcohol dehydrogenase family)
MTKSWRDNLIFRRGAPIKQAEYKGVELNLEHAPIGRLDGLRALVTGASGGLGRAIGDCLAQQGAEVFGTSRTAESAAEIAAHYGTLPVVLDATKRDDAIRVVTELYDRVGGIQLLVNNAGINIPQKSAEVDSTSWDSVIETNLSGVFFVTQAIARRWIEDETKGRIVNVGSQAGTVAIEERAAYGSSKAALAHLTRILALEWAPYGIRVNAVAPTFVRTALTESTFSRPGLEEKLTARIPLGRLGVTNDVAPAVAFLLSEDSGLITGHVLAIDGGYTIH